MMTPMLLLLSLCGVALADPVALRMPAADVVAVAGWPETSVGAWVKPGFGLSVDWRFPASSVAISMGSRKILAGTPDRWGIDGALAGGPVLPLVAPGLALGVAPSVRVRRNGRLLDGGLDLAVPAAFRVTGGFEARVPVLLEASLLVHVGRFSVGALGGAGPVLVTGGTASASTQGAIVVTWDRPEEPAT